MNAKSGTLTSQLTRQLTCKEENDKKEEEKMELELVKKHVCIRYIRSLSRLPVFCRGHFTTYATLWLSVTAVYDTNITVNHIVPNPSPHPIKQ